MAAEFNASGAILLSALLPQETGYWNPVVTTGPDGTATLTLTVPERRPPGSSWKGPFGRDPGRRGDRRPGGEEGPLRRDQAAVGLHRRRHGRNPVTVHNDAIEKGTIEVVLRTTIAGRKVEETKRIEVAGKGLQEVSFKVELKRPEGKASR